MRHGCWFYFLLISFYGQLSCLRAQSPAGQWKEARLLAETMDGKGELVKAWDSHPEMNLEFSWIGGINANHEAEGYGVLTWKKRNHGAIVSEFRGQLKNGLSEGRGFVSLPDGATYFGNWKQNLKCGSGRFFHANGDYHEGTFLDDKMSGHGIYTETDGSAYDGEFLNGNRHGTGVMTLSNGQSYDSQWEAGRETADSLARRAAAETKAPPLFEVAVGLDQAYMKKLASEEEGESTFLYRSWFSKGNQVIESAAKMVDEARLNGMVRVTEEIGIVGLGCGPVPLNLTVANPGSTPLLIESALLQVEESLPDLKPMLVLWGTDIDGINMFPSSAGRHGKSGEDEEQDDEEDEDENQTRMLFGLTNIGHGHADNCVLEFDLSPMDVTDPGLPNPAQAFKFRKELGKLDQRLQICVEPELIELGVDTVRVAAPADLGINPNGITKENAKVALGPFARFDQKGKWLQSNARLDGRLSYDWTDASGASHHEQTDFRALILLDPRDFSEFGTPGATHGESNLLMPLKQSNYTLPFPWKKQIPPGGKTTFNLKLCAPKSSHHRFRIVLKCADGSERKSAPILLDVFLPRGGEAFVRSELAPLK